MIVLLDTHAFIWWNQGGSSLSPRAREVIEDPDSTVLFSAVSAYEIALKFARGSLELPTDAALYVPERLSRHGFDILPMTLDHALRAGALPMIHKDPFDRVLIAQAQVEAIPIITADPAIGLYDVEVIW